ncbi:hypothetical protein GPECTOR_10g876 [Gonium pectorale]|uniref:Tify domain-containing protein n=1 Tax=Gonium pectorale TaxID=33097 RepID=A0A150GQY5_GONPE|nr:hypothetical protein GPECTOR_10g876 [Gonium pectorale]|eukprot:KXZ52245.1 hypothetical protein GPECTOR_10g876 [Gonium pectorale]
MCLSVTTCGRQASQELCGKQVVNKKREVQARPATSPSDLLPPEFQVTIKGGDKEQISGTFVVADGRWHVLCGCRECGGRRAFGPTQWELHVGSRYKKYHQSIRIVPGGGVPEVPTGKKPLALGGLLALYGFMADRSRGADVPPVLLPLEDGVRRRPMRPRTHRGPY